MKKFENASLIFTLAHETFWFTLKLCFLIQFSLNKIIFLNTVIIVHMFFMILDKGFPKHKRKQRTEKISKIIRILIILHYFWYPSVVSTISAFRDLFIIYKKYAIV